jgi:hypothetical protein
VLVTGARDDDPVGAAGPTGGWTTAGCAVARAPHRVLMGDTPMLVTPPALDAAMARIDAGGRADHAGSYAGLEVDQEQVRAIVYRVPSATFDDFVRRSAEDACIVVRDAAHGLTELTAWHDRLVGDLATWTGEGLPISSVGARHDGAGVEVGTSDVVRAREALLARYGEAAPLIFVEQGPVTPLRPQTRPATPQPGG